MSGYLAGSTSALERAFHTLRHLVSRLMQTTAEPSDIFPKERQVDEWKESLRSLPVRIDLQNHERLLAIRDDTVVTRMYFCKQKSASKHEYIVANLRRQDHHGHPIFVHATIERSRADSRSEDDEGGWGKEVERRYKNDTAPRKGTVNSIPSGIHSASPFSVASSSLQKWSNALDRIRCDPGEFNPASPLVIKYYTFCPGHEPSLIDLAVAAFVAHDHDHYYSLFLHQCYWYADAVCAVIEAVVGDQHYTVKTKKDLRSEDKVYLGESELKTLNPSAHRNHPSERTSAIIELLPDQWSKLKQGYNVVKITTRNPFIAESLRKEFNKVKKEFDKTVTLANERIVKLKADNEDKTRQLMDKDRQILELQARLASHEAGRPIQV